MKLGVIIPDRGDREKFLENCLRQLSVQTFTDFEVRIVSYPPKDHHVDITPRYRTGYEYFSGKDYDLIAFVENDDWISPDYLETMVAAWERYHRPSLLGTCYTIYYHLQLKAYFTMEHHQRSSAMNTFIKPDLNINWPVDMEPFLDMRLWSKEGGIEGMNQRIVFRPEKIISVGIKHGIGKTIAGGNHIVDDRVRRRYATPDVNTDYPNGFLKTVMDAESFEFYNNYFTQ